MLGVWNTVIKTPYMQFNTVFTITEDDKGGVRLVMETEPAFRKLRFENIRIEGRVLKAEGIDADGQKQAIELIFAEDSFTGSIEFPYLGLVSFAGERGRGQSLADKLERYGKLSVQENRYWQAKWIWDVPQPESNPDLEHHLVYFRRTFHVPELCKPKLVIDITADSRYRLFVNGRSVAVGPCKGDRDVHYYETVDVSELLMPGRNAIAVQVLHYPAAEPFVEGKGGPKSIWRLQSGGLLVEANLRDENGRELEPLHSGPEWRAKRHIGYRNVPKSLIRWMGGVEEVDGTGAPQGWQEADYDDTDWLQAIPFADTRKPSGNLSPWNLMPRPIPFLYENERLFTNVTITEGVGRDHAERLIKKAASEPLHLQPEGKFAVELDAGELTTGYLTIRLRGGRGSIVRLLSSECYDEQGSSERQRKKGNREDTSGKLIGEFDVYHAAGSGGRGTEEVYEPFLFRTFRYVRLEVETGPEPLELAALNYRETGYPLDAKAHFECSDDELNQIWEMSLRTLRRCMHETYEDCPYYEQLQYAMDSRLMMLFTYYVSADDRMPRRTIADFYRSRMPSGLLQSRYPSMESQVIPSFSFYWVDMIDEHYEFNGDRELVMKYRPAIIELMDWFHERLTDDGIVGVTSNRYWNYFDWVEAWPLGAPPESADRPSYLLSLMYAASLRKAARLMHLTDWQDVAGEMERRADNVCNAVRKMAWSEERQLFRELPDTEIYSQHTQILAVLSRTVNGEEARSLLEHMLEQPLHRVTLPFAYLLFQALKQTGLQERAFELWDRWRPFAKQGLTTLPETEVNPRSDCHAWSSVPLAEFPSSILGVTPLEPGFRTIHIEPQPGALQWAKGKVPTALGMVEVEWHREGSWFELRAKVPDGVTATVKLPDGTEQTMQGEKTFIAQEERLSESSSIIG